MTSTPQAFRSRPSAESVSSSRTLKPLKSIPASSASRSTTENRSGSVQPLRYTRPRSEEHTSELQSLMRISYAVFCLKKKNKKKVRIKPTAYIDQNIQNI